MDIRNLIKEAMVAKEFSYSPYSGFAVGAALLGVSGKIYKGCNVESAAYSPSNCAERTAVFKAVSEGETEFLAIAVVGALKDSDMDFCYPCGVCRQVLSEFAREDFTVIAAKSEEEYKLHKLEELLPFHFGGKDIIKGK